MKHLLYTEDQFGRLQCVPCDSDEEVEKLYEKILQEKRFEYHMGDRLIRVLPTYVVVVEDVKDYDFVSNDSRLKSVKNNPPQGNP